MNESSKHVAVIGAGPSGILMGIRLLQRGHNDFTIYEKAPGLGGTWWYNRYPGVACDVPSAYYCYSFSPNTMAKNTFASGRDLYEYFRAMAEQYGVADHIVYDTEITDMRWDGAIWNLTTQTGEELQAKIVVSAVGRLHQPKYPDIEGIEDFAGTIVHSAVWNDEIDLTGQRLGVIGTGSSAVQIVSASANQVGHLELFQRTPQWIYPATNETIPEEVLAARRADINLAKARYYEIERELNEKITLAVVDGESEFAAARAQACYDNLATVKDPVLRAKLTPSYEVGCKRLVISGTFYDAVQRPNVDVVTTGIQRIERSGIRTVDGSLHELDVIVLATGFKADSYLRPITVTGAGGRTLEDIWADSYVNYKSVALPYMPNLFTINGPFGPSGSVSTLIIIEEHVEYVLKLIDLIDEGNAAIAPDWDRSVELLEEIVGRAKETVWYTGGCKSWYLDKNGVPLLNPLTVQQLHDDLSEVARDDLHFDALKPERLRSGALS
jgi:cation diffusion facilitator CzcD-associated flavoprotein CzcO